jgi:hypothetical protein
MHYPFCPEGWLLAYGAWAPSRQFANGSYWHFATHSNVLNLRLLWRRTGNESHSGRGPAASFNHLIGGHEQLIRYFQAERRDRRPAIAPPRRQFGSTGKTSLSPGPSQLQFGGEGRYAGAKTPLAGRRHAK